MCTALTFNMNGFYCGRTLDVECDYGQTVTAIPKKFDFGFKTKYSVNKTSTKLIMSESWSI